MAVLAPRKADLRSVGDGQLAAMAASGDEAAFEAIFERHHRGLLSFCRHLLGSLEEAEDALQHTFAAAYRQLTERGPLEHLRAWLYRTARNRCTDILRSRREVPAPAPEVSTAGLPEEVERRSDLRELVSDIGRLPDDQRAALVLSEIEDLGHAEVADVLGCGRDKVRALVYQARLSLAGWREARQLPCREVREEIAVAHGGGLRRAHLRRHLKLCAGCAAFRKDMDRQRRRVALVLPVLAAPGLKESVLEAALAAGGAAAGGGGAAAGGGGAAAGGGGAAAGGGVAAGGGAAEGGAAAAGGGAAAAGGGAAAAGSLGAAGVKIGAAVLALGGAGIATFGGLFGGGDVAPDRAGPAPAVQPASAVAREERARRDERRAQREERERRRLRVRGQAPAPAGGSVEPVSGSEPESLEAEPESLEPAPAPPTESPAPPPGGEPAPEEPAAGDQAPAPSPGGQSPGGQPPPPAETPSPSPQPAPAPQPPAEVPAPQPGIEAEIEAQLPVLP
jgi:RNA polymerase sigma factor (sigma-70 family)